MPMSNVRGITRAEQEFLNFFELVQEEAGKLGHIFFISDQERHDHVLEDLYLTEMSGWLVPAALADEFEKPWRDHDDSVWKSDAWNEFFVFEDFSLKSDGTIEIRFDKY